MRRYSRRNFLLSYSPLLVPFYENLAQAVQENKPILSKRDWNKARSKLLAGMQLVMGKLPTIRSRPLPFNILTSVEAQNFTSKKIRYPSEPGDFVDAYLLIPKRRSLKAPAMVCLHQTTKIGKDEPAGLGGNSNLHYAKELAARGYVCIVPDYPYLGENTFDPYSHGYLSCTMKGIVNHIQAVTVLQSLPEVDRNRIGAIGHSLGGHNTLFLAAFDERIRVMVSSCGFTKASKYFNGNLKGWAGQRYMPLIEKKYDNDPAKIPFDFPELLVALAPRPLFINAPEHDSNFEVSGVRDCVSAASRVYEKIFKAGERLIARYPNVAHDFPDPIRSEAYEFLDQWLMQK